MKVISDNKSSIVINWRYRVNGKDYAVEASANARALNWRYKLAGVTYEPIQVSKLSSPQMIRAINWRYQIHPSELN
jgi:hypothetical protein